MIPAGKVCASFFRFHQLILIFTILITMHMSAILLFGMPGMGEWVIIGLFVLVFFGAKKIPDFAKGLGKGIREFKDAVKDVKKEVDDAGKEAKIDEGSK